MSPSDPTTAAAIEANRRLWDAWTGINVPSAFYDVASFRDGRRPIRVSDYERAEVGAVDGKSLLHLQCHIGLDTLSWARLGAVVTGVDFSDAAVAAASSLAAELGSSAAISTICRTSSTRASMWSTPRRASSGGSRTSVAGRRW